MSYSQTEADLIRENAQLRKEREELIQGYQELLNHVSEWCAEIKENGGGWDNWDSYYKKMQWGGIEKHCALLAKLEGGK
jgi:hypothetical protein